MALHFWVFAVVVLFSNVIMAQQAPSLLEERSTHVCGPVATCTALRLLGGNVTLAQVARLEGWEMGQSVSVADLCRVICDQPGFEADATKLDFSDLERALELGQAVILLVGDDLLTEPNHAEVAFRGENGRSVIIDYPFKPMALSESMLKNKWSGYAVIVSRKGQKWCEIRYVCWIAEVSFAMMCAGAGVIWIRRWLGAGE